MRRKKWLKFFAVVSLLLAVGVTSAMMFRRSAAMENKLIPAEVMCEVHEEFNGSEKSSITVENTGNIDCYVRVRLVSYWLKEKNGENEIDGEGLVRPAIEYDEDLWKQAEDDTHTFYYLKKLAPEDTTGNLLKEGTSIKLAEKTAADGSVFHRVIEVFAEAIQAEPNDAVSEAWGFIPGETINP